MTHKLRHILLGIGYLLLLFILAALFGRHLARLDRQAERFEKFMQQNP